MLPDVQWKPIPISQLPSWENASRIVIDLETEDQHLKTLGPGVRRGGRVCGIGFGIEDGPKHYLPIGHSSDNLDPVQVWSYIRDNAKKFRGKVGGANFGYDLDYLLENGVEFPNIAGFWDIQVNEPLIDDLQYTYGYDAIAERHGVPGKDKSVLNQACQAFGISMNQMHKLPGRYVVQYSLADLTGPLIIARRQEKIIEEQDLGMVQALENRLLPVLVRMRRRGVRVSTDRLDQFEKLMFKVEQECLDFVRSETGIVLGTGDVDNKGALLRVLKALGVNTELLPHTAGGKNKKPEPKVDKAVLSGLNHPVGDALLRARKACKYRGTFVNGIRRHLVKGRVHPTFNQLRTNKDDDSDEDGEGARWGRISCVDPNLLQQPNPKKDPEFGKLWRSIYLAEEGQEWFSDDFSQQEPRNLLHYAELTGCTKAREAAEEYRRNPKTDTHTLTAQMIAGRGSDWKPSDEERDSAKIVRLALQYGMGGAKFCRSIGLPTQRKFIEKLGLEIEVAGEEGQKMLDDFHAGVPYIREMSQKCMDAVRAKGYIRTLTGRRCRFPEKPPEQRKNKFDTHEWMHKAISRLIQGTSADQTKIATVEVEEAGHFLQLQVYDELGGSCSGRKEGEQVAEIMMNCVKLLVPSKVDVEIGPSWGEAK